VIPRNFNPNFAKAGRYMLHHFFRKMLAKKVKNENFNQHTKMLDQTLKNAD
jgi:hypothetical protein